MSEDKDAPRIFVSIHLKNALKEQHRPRGLNLPRARVDYSAVMGSAPIVPISFVR